MSKRKKKTIEDKKNAALYCRVSTHEQGRGDYSSLKSQEDALRKYCEFKGWKVYDLYSDTKSGTNFERDEMQRLLRDAEEKKFNVVVSIKLDRISRSVQDFLAFDQKLKELDIDIVITTQDIDTTTPVGYMVRTVMLAFGQFERDVIAERTREKLYYQAQKGFWKGGIVPLGYDCVDKKLIINKKEAELVNKIFNYYLAEPSTAKVMNRLNNEGYRTKKRISKDGKNTGGGLFTKETIKRLLRSKLYRGIIRFNSEEFKGLHEPIIDEELFNAVQKRLDESITDPQATYDGSELSLLGVIRCGYCGSRMSTTFTTKKSGKRYYYYKCTRSAHTSKQHCSARDIKADDIEIFTQKLISHLASDKEFFKAAIQQMKTNTSDDLEEKLDKKGGLVHNLREINKELENLVNFVAQNPEVANTATFLSKIKEREEAKAALEGTITKLSLDIERIQRQSVNETKLRMVFKEFNQIYETLTPSVQRRLNHLFIAEIRSHLKRGEDSGLLEFHIRGDGSITAGWEELVNQISSGSRYWDGWLHRQDSNLQPIG
jgi:site-specific DNA recombinase